MSTSVTLPNTIQIRPSRLTGLVAAVAILTAVTTWSVSQVTTGSDASSNAESGVVSTQGAATQAYIDGVVALDPEQRAAIFGNLASTPQSVQSVNAQSPELQAINVSPTQAIAAMARAEGLTGLSPASLRSPTQQSVQSVNAQSPELQAINVSPTQAIAAMARAEGLTGLSPASLRSPTLQSVQSVNAQSPELQAINVSPDPGDRRDGEGRGVDRPLARIAPLPSQPFADAIADLSHVQLAALFGTFS